MWVRIKCGYGRTDERTDIISSCETCFPSHIHVLSSWKTLDTRRKNSKAVFMYKMLHDNATPNLKDLFIQEMRRKTITIPEIVNYDLTLPKPRTEYLRRSFKYSGAKLWNNLPFAAKSASNVLKREICTN